MKRGKRAKQLSISYQANAAAESKSPRNSSSSPEFYKLDPTQVPPCPTHLSVVPFPSRGGWPGITSVNVSSDIQPVANYCNPTSIQETISFVHNFQNQHKLLVGTILYFITAVTFSTLCHTLHVYPLWSGTSETVMSTLLLPRLDKWETIFVNISLLLTESPLLNCTRCIALNRTEGSPSQSEPWSAGKVIYDGSHDMWVLHSSQVSSLYSFIKKVSFTRLKSFEQLLHGLYVADIFWTPVTARSIFITCSVNSPWVSRQSLILLPQQEKHSGVRATGQANGIFHISS